MSHAGSIPAEILIPEVSPTLLLQNPPIAPILLLQRLDPGHFLFFPSFFLFLSHPTLPFAPSPLERTPHAPPLDLRTYRSPRPP